MAFNNLNEVREWLTAHNLNDDKMPDDVPPITWCLVSAPFKHFNECPRTYMRYMIDYNTEGLETYVDNHLGVIERAEMDGLLPYSVHEVQCHPDGTPDPESSDYEEV